MTEPVRIGVIGAGSFGQRHIRAYARNVGVEIVGIADCDADRAQSVAARWGISNWYEDGLTMLRSCRPDGVSVATPASHHLEPTLAALAQSCSVLLEKPVALSSVDVATIVDAAHASEGFVMPAHILRFAAPYIELRGRLRGGAIGTLLGVSAVRDRGRGHAQLFPDLHPALMTAIHDIDLALWLSATHAVRVSAHGRGRNGDGRPTLLFAAVEAADGSVWSLRTSWLMPNEATPSDRLEVYGTQGAITLDLKPTVAVLGMTVENVDHELTPDTHLGALDAEIAHFCACIREGTEPTVVTLSEAANGVQIAEAIVASDNAGGEVIDLSA